MDGFFDNLIDYVRVDTAYLPPLVIPQPFVPAAPGESTVLRTLKPRIEIGIGGGDPIVVQKWGDPRPGRWSEILTYLGLGGGVVVALAGYGLYTALKGRGRSKPAHGLGSLHRGRRRR